PSALCLDNLISSSNPTRPSKFTLLSLHDALPISLVGEQHAGSRTGLVHDRHVAFHVGDLSAAQRDRDREAESVAAEVDLGRETTTRAAKTLVRIPFFSAPAAC